MCYQVVERYSVCRCLYYRHSIDPCKYHGVEGHAAVEKTVLVGYACAQHSSTATQPSVKDLYETFSDHSSDDTGEEQSIFSNALVPCSAASSITVDEDDAIDEILRVLVEDPLLNWPKLFQSHGAGHLRSSRNDVRFFLRAFESDLRVTARSMQGILTCNFFGSRIRYLSAQICEHFNIPDSAEEDENCEDNFALKVSELRPISAEDADSEFSPPLQYIRTFVFDGMAFSSLKEYLRCYTSIRRDYSKEIIDILTKNIILSDVEKMSTRLQKDDGGDLAALLEVFIYDLQQEAFDNKWSASDIKGLRPLSKDVTEVETQLRAFWGTGKPAWYYYYPVPGAGSELPAGVLASMYELERFYEYEDFHDFVCASKSFLRLKTAIEKYSEGTINRRPWLQKAEFICSRIIARPRPLAPGIARIPYTCSCGRSIYDDYAQISPDGIDNLQKSLRMLSVRQRYYRTHAPGSTTRGFGSLLKGLFGSKTSPDSPTTDTTLPQHQTRFSDNQISNHEQCIGHASNDSGGHKFVHWCVPSTRFATKMLPLQTCAIQSDFDFFTALKMRYRGTTTRMKQIMSFKKPIALRFVKFQLYHRQLVDIHKPNDIPPESRKNEYEYFPMPAETIPPIGPNLLMHFFTHPEDASEKPVLLHSIPKRKRDQLEPCPVRGSSLGWGIDVLTGNDDFKIFLCGVLGFFLSMVFGVVWAVVRNDIQGGFGVAAYIFAFFGFLIACLKAAG